MGTQIRHRKSCRSVADIEQGQAATIISFPQSELHEQVVFAGLALGDALENAVVDPEYLLEVMRQVLKHVLQDAPWHCPSPDLGALTDDLLPKVCIFARGFYTGAQEIFPTDVYETMTLRMRARIADESFLIGVVHAVAKEVLQRERG